MKKFIYIVLGILILFISFFCIIYFSMDSYKIKNLSTYNDFKEYSNSLLIRLDDTDANTMLDLKEDYYKQLQPTVTNISIFEVEAGNTFTQKGATFIQDAIVKKVIEGDKMICDKNIYLTKTGGIVVNQELKEKVYIDTVTCVNIMTPGDRYLVFCEKSELSDMLDTNTPQYRFVGAKFALLNIDRDDKTAILDYSIENDDPYALYNKYLNQEFFTTSDETLSAFLEIKHDIFEKYNVK